MVAIVNFVLIRRSSSRGAASRAHVRRSLATLTLLLAGLALPVLPGAVSRLVQLAMEATSTMVGAG